MLQKGEKEEWLKELSLEKEHLEREREALKTEEERLIGRIEVLRNLVGHGEMRGDMREDAKRELAEYDARLKNARNEKEERTRKLRYIGMKEEGIEDVD